MTRCDFSMRPMERPGHIHPKLHICKQYPFLTRTQSDIVVDDGYDVDNDDFPELSLHPDDLSPDDPPLVPASQVEVHKDMPTGKTGSAPGSNVLHRWYK